MKPNHIIVRRLFASALVLSAVALFEGNALAQTDMDFDNIWHVDADDGNDMASGFDWDNALQTLQRGLDKAVDSLGSDLVKVAQGTYEPELQTDPPDPRSATYLIDFPDVTVEGGYAGINNQGVDPDDLDSLLYVTVLSGAIPVAPVPPCGDAGTDDCFVANPTVLGCADPACCEAVCNELPFCCLFGWDEDCVNGALQACPAGVYHVVTIDGVPQGSVGVKGVTITGGGANGGLPDQDLGGGMLIRDASPSIVRCIFSRNGGFDGGAVAIVRESSEPFLVNCSFLRNTAAGNGAGVYVDTGNVQVAGPSPFFVNCVFSGNVAHTQGGALFIDRSGQAALVNCTLSRNEALQGGGVFVSPLIQGDATALLCATNSILWNNDPDQVSGNALISFSDVQGGGFSGDGNIDEDPLFVDELGFDMQAGTGDEDLRLDLMTSPASDAGNTARVPADVGDLDRDGDFGERTSLDLGNGGRVALATQNAMSQCDQGNVDMGAFENGNCDGDSVRDEDETDANGDGVPDDCQDCNGNGTLDPQDIQNKSSRDCNQNGIPDECDTQGGCSLDTDGDEVPDECTLIWQLKADFVDPQHNNSGIEGASASLIDGMIYVSHGFRDNLDTASLSVYDIANDVWTHGGPSAPDASVIRSELGGATAFGRHYAIGGRKLSGIGAGPRDTLEEFDPLTMTWQDREALFLGPRAGLGAASWNDKIYALGGRDDTIFGDGTILDSNEVYDPMADVWVPLMPLPTAVSDNYATLAYQGKIYVFGGATSPQSVTTDVQIYDIQTNSWTFGAPMRTPRAAAMAGVIDGKIAVFGGFDPDPCVLTTNLIVTEIYDPDTDHWFPGPPLVEPASEVAQGVTWDASGVYAIGSGIFGAQQVHVQRLVPSIVCTGDVDGDGAVGITDFLQVLGSWGPCPSPCPPACTEDLDGDCNVGIIEFLFVLGTWGACPVLGLPDPLTLEQELADACLTAADWDEYVDVMTDEAGSQATKDRYDCWMRHYMLDCSRCQCPHTGTESGCPNPDPFS